MFTNLKLIKLMKHQKKELFKFFFFLFFLNLLPLLVIAQTENVGIGQSTAPTFPNNSALLDLDVSNMATKRGLLIPRMTTAQMNSITSPATGLIIYNTSDNNFYYYTGSQWIELVSAIATVGFDKIATGTNTSATMTVGNGASILPAGTGSVQANKFVTSASLTDNVDLATSEVNGILPIANGGTGTSTTPTNGQLLIGNGTSYAVANLTQGTGITVTNGVGTITISTNASQIDHGSLSGLADDDHTQYALLAGRAGGQTLYGGTAASNNLTLSSTSNVTKGNYVFSDFTTAGFVKTNASGVLSVSGNVNLATEVTGTLSIANGGTNATSYTSNEFIWYNGSSLVASGYNQNSFEPAVTKGNLTESGSSVLTITGGTGAVIGTGTTIQVAQASGTTSGYLSSTDWNTFNNKENALTFNSPLSRAINTISITQASGTTDGYLSASDWNTFNNKQAPLTLGDLSTSTSGVTITGGTGAVVGSGATIDIATANGTTTGLLSASDWNTFNNKQAPLTLGNLSSSTSGVTITGGTGAVVGSGATIDIATANGTTTGLLSATDWNTFNNKQAPLTLGNLSSSTSGVTITGGTGAVIGSGATIDIATANGTTTGLLSATDWNTFNNKQAPLTLGNLSTSTSGVTITGGTGAVVGSGATIDIATANGTTTGLLSATDWNTFNNKVGGSGTNNRVAYWNGTGSITYSDNFIFDGNNIGLGIIINPSYRLNVSGDVQFSGTTTTGTGLIVSSGGANITGASTHTGNITLANTGTASELRLREPSGSGTNYTAFKATTQSADITYTLPNQLPGTNGFLRSDNAGNLDWQSVSTVPTGTSEGQTLRWDNTGSEWDVSSLIINTGTNVGINITSPAVLLHQDNGNATATYHKFTAGTTTGQTSTDGFNIGIDNTGNAQLYQYENLDMMFYTNNTERVRILNSGNVGIGTNSPQNKLDIEGAVAIGSSYSGSVTAPSNGLIVEGKVGIGTSTVSPDSIYFKVVGDAMVDGDLVVTGTIDPKAIFMVPLTNTPSEPVAGMFYYDDNDDNFKFYTGQWVTPVWSSGESLPSGTDGATLRHNGSAWVSATNLYNDGTNVGINTSSLSNARFKVVDATATDGFSAFRVENSSATAGTSYALYATKTGAGTTNVGGYFSASGGTNNYGLIVANGFSGFGTTSPEVTVDIDGGLALRTEDIINVTSDDFNVTVGNRSYIKLSSNAAPTSRTISLSNGLRVGQILIIEVVSSGTNGIELNRSLTTNLKQTATSITLDDFDVAVYIWDGNYWVMVSARAQNS